MKKKKKKTMKIKKMKIKLNEIENFNKWEEIIDKISGDIDAYKINHLFENENIYNQVMSGEISVDDLINKSYFDLDPEPYQDIIDKQNEMKNITIDVESIKINCFKCGGKEGTYICAQLRSIDEGADVIKKCLNCGFSWTEGN